MTKAELIKGLIECIGGDAESSHIVADKLLLKFINDIEVSKIFNKIDKWYA